MVDDAMPLLVRLGEGARRAVELMVDGEALTAREGDTLLVAVLAARGRLRVHEFDGAPRAGFCLMGACHDCVLWTEDGEQLRACSTPVAAGMRIVTATPPWPLPGS